jgi:RNA polymerase sigma-70 factor (ECF subfamily)
MEHLLEQWVEQAKGGSKEAFSELVKATQQKLLSYAYPMLGNVQDAEDVVQEVYIRMYQHLDKYREHVSIMAWLYTICYRLCMNKLKKRTGLMRLIPVLRQEAAVHEHNAMNRTEPEHDLSLLDGLDADERNLVVMRVIQGLTYEEISGITGSSAAALRKRYERVRQKLQRKCRAEQLEQSRELPRHIELKRGVATYDQSL